MKSRRAVLSGLAAFAIGLAGLPGPTESQTPRPRPAQQPAQVTSAAPATQITHGRLVIMRGLVNIFSRGMDAMAERFEASGLPVILINHTKWRKTADQLIAEYNADPKSVEPIIIIGHSLGGDAGLVMSNYLGLNRVPVRLLVTFDAVAQTHPIIWNTQEVVNYYKPKGYGQEVKAGKGFSGTITNIDLTKRKDLSHVTIDKDLTLQNEVIIRVLEIHGLSPAAASG